LPRKARFRAAVGFAAAAARAGAAWLGAALLISNPEPAVLLGVAGGVVLLLGGSVSSTRSRFVRVLVCLAAVVVARLVAGPLLATLVALVIAVGWWLRIVPSDALVALAAFGVGAAAAGMASLRVFVSFWTLGAFTVAAARGVRRLRGRGLSRETRPSASLAHEN
jgi:hypothetical protein